MQEKKNSKDSFDSKNGSFIGRKSNQVTSILFDLQSLDLYIFKAFEVVFCDAKIAIHFLFGNDF